MGFIAVIKAYHATFIIDYKYFKLLTRDNTFKLMDKYFN